MGENACSGHERADGIPRFRVGGPSPVSAGRVLAARSVDTAAPISPTTSTATTTTTTKQRSDLGNTAHPPHEVETGHQLLLDSPAFEGMKPPRCRRQRKSRRSPTEDSDPLLDTFRRRCRAQHKPRTAEQYTWTLRSALDLAIEVTGRSFTVAGLFKDVDALSLSIATDRRVGGGAKLSMWTIASKRAGIRCVARLLTPELRSLGIPDPLQVIDRALQRRSTRIGTRYSLPGGTPRGRGGKTPDVPTVRALLDALGDRQGWEGIRNQVFFEVMYLTGVRVGALTLLDGSMLRRRSDGTGQLVAHAKHGRDSGEFVIPKETMAQIDRYVTDFNLWALARGKVQRIRIGSEGALWRSITGGPMAAETPGKMLRSACKAIEIEALTPHSFRRAFATTATEALSRATVAEAGGWTGDQRMDDHYIQRSTNSVQEAIGGVRQSLSSSPIPITPLPPTRPLTGVR